MNLFDAKRPISATQIESFLRCPRAWYAKYVLGYGSDDSDAMNFGKVVHELLALYFEDRDEAKLLYETERSALLLRPDEAELLKQVIVNYIKYDHVSPYEIPKREDCDVFLIEEKFVVDVDGVYVLAKPDLFYIKDDIGVIVEHKTTGRNWSELDFHRNIQSKIYPAVLKRIFPQLKEIHMLYDVMIKDFPKKPEVTAKGKISKAKLVTTKELFIEAVLDNGETVEEYQDHIDNIRDPIFNERIKMEITEPEIWFDTLQQYIKQMRIMSKTLPYPVPNGFNCGHCSFAGACLHSEDPAKILQYAERNLEKRRSNGSV